MRMEVFTTAQAASWHEVLRRCNRHDFYHLPEYHALAEQPGEGDARLFAWTDGAYTVALPLLLRPLHGLPGAEAGWHDATSVYGYAGPIASHDHVPEAIVAQYQESLRRRLHELQVVALFSRLHAFLPQAQVIAGLGECEVLKTTVSIDLTRSLEKQRAEYRDSYKVGVNKLRRKGLTCVLDHDGAYLEEFVRIYHETMRRVDAQDEYFFSLAYFKQLMENLPARVHLFVCLVDGRVICGGLFIGCSGVLQYHLGGTLDEALKIGPMKLVVDEVRVWATGQGYEALHLGGGVTTSPHDSLLHFKTGFSDRRHNFTVWRWILDADANRRLCDAQMRIKARENMRPASEAYFPAYRCPLIPAVTAIPAPVGSTSPSETARIVAGVTP